MTDDEYRKAIQDSEDGINEGLKWDLSALLGRMQKENRTFLRVPGLIAYTEEYRLLVEQAQAKMRTEANLIERCFYAELDELILMEFLTI